MKNSYIRFYDNLYTVVGDGKTTKIHKHQKLSSDYIQKIIEAIFIKNRDIKQYEKLIRSTFGFETSEISYMDLISEYKLEEKEFIEIIGKFIKSFTYAIYFRVNIYKVFFIFLIGFLFLSSINILFYDFNYYFNIIKNKIGEVTIIILMFVVFIPFISFSKSYIINSTKNILIHYK